MRQGLLLAFKTGYRSVPRLRKNWLHIGARKYRSSACVHGRTSRVWSSPEGGGEADEAARRDDERAAKRSVSFNVPFVRGLHCLISTVGCGLNCSQASGVDGK
jgi:hypothetical protein